MAILINEFCTRDCPNSIGGDYIELYNSGTEAVDLTGWKISDSGATTTITYDNPNSTIQANGFLIIRANESLGDTASDFGWSDNIFDVPWKLGGTDTITIRQPNDTIEDQYAYSGHPCVDNTGLVWARSWDGGDWPSSYNTTNCVAATPGTTNGPQPDDGEILYGCTDPEAINYVAGATDDGSCVYLCTTEQTADCICDLKINELCPYGSACAGESDFMEIYNPNNFVCSLSNIQTNDFGADDEVALGDVNLASNGYHVITFGGLSASGDETIQITTDYELSNYGLYVIDEVTPFNNPSGLSGSPSWPDTEGDYSLQRSPDGADYWVITSTTKGTTNPEPIPVDCSPYTLRFSEIQATGSEWIEIYNYGGYDVDLNNVVFVGTNDEPGSQKFINFEICNESLGNTLLGTSCDGTCILPAGEVLVIFERTIDGCGNDHPDMSNVTCYQENFNGATTALANMYAVGGCASSGGPCDEGDVPDCAHIDGDEDNLGLFLNDPTGLANSWTGGGTLPRWNPALDPAPDSCQIDIFSFNGLDKSPDRSYQLINYTSSIVFNYDDPWTGFDQNIWRYANGSDRNPGFTVDPVYGCTDADACNFDPLANTYDGTCVYPGPGCNPDGSGDGCPGTIIGGWNCLGVCVAPTDGDCDCGQLQDCFGECGGPAELDECGECGGDGADFECPNGDIVCGEADCAPQADCRLCQTEEFKVGAPVGGWIINHTWDPITNNSTDTFTEIFKNMIGWTDLSGTVNDNGIIDELFERYNELRAPENPLANDEIEERIDYYSQYFKEISKNNDERWNFLGTSRYPDYEFDWPTSLNYTNPYERYVGIVDDFRDWVFNRINWMDHNIRRIRHQTDIGHGEWCKNNPFLPEGQVGSSYCNDITAQNTNENSNFNDGSCEYYAERRFTFQVDVGNVSWPPVVAVDLEIVRINGFIVNLKFEMEEISPNNWIISLQRFMNENVKPGDIIDYHFIKYTPEVYTLLTGSMESDIIESFIVGDEFEISISRKFNNFIDVLEETNLPIVKIDTYAESDSPDTSGRWYCPGYLGMAGGAAGALWENWDGDSTECEALKDWIDDPNGDEGYELEDENGDGTGVYFGYFSSQEICQINTGCSLPCTDGTNIFDDPKITAEMKIIYNGEDAMHSPDDEPQVITKIGIEVRGFSHRGFPKKQYAIELQQGDVPQCDNINADRELMCNGFQPEIDISYDGKCIFDLANDYVLLGPIRDRTYMKNVLSYELWEELQESYDYPTGVKTKYVETYINDIYMGLYVLMERVEIGENRINIPLEIECTDGDLESCNGGGFVIKIESGGEQDFFLLNDGKSKIEFYDPKASRLNQTETDFISKQMIIATEGVRNPPKWDFPMVDYDTFVDYWLLEEFARNNEGFTRSQYWYTYGDYTNDPNQIDCGFLGCTYQNATNYESDVEGDDISCEFPIDDEKNPINYICPDPFNQSYDPEHNLFLYTHTGVQDERTCKYYAGLRCGYEFKGFQTIPNDNDSCVCLDNTPEPTQNSGTFENNNCGLYELSSTESITFREGESVTISYNDGTSVVVDKEFTTYGCKTQNATSNGIPVEYLTQNQLNKMEVCNELGHPFTCLKYNYDNLDLGGDGFCAQEVSDCPDYNSVVGYCGCNEYGLKNNGGFVGGGWEGDICDCNGNFYDECGVCGGLGAKFECPTGGMACNYYECPPDEINQCIDYKFYMGPVWDFNHSYGGIIKETEKWSTEIFYAVSEFWYKFIMGDEFINKVNIRWNDIKNNILDSKKIINRVDEIYNQFKINGAIIRDNNRWFSSENQNFDLDVKEFKKWILQRLFFMEKSICGTELGGNIYCGEESSERLDFFPPGASSPNSAYYKCSSSDDTLYLSGDCVQSPNSRKIMNIFSPNYNQKFNPDEDDYIDIEYVISYNLKEYLSNIGEFAIVNCMHDVVLHYDPEGIENQIPVATKSFITYNVDSHSCTGSQNEYWGLFPTTIEYKNAVNEYCNPIEEVDGEQIPKDWVDNWPGYNKNDCIYYFSTAGNWSDWNTQYLDDQLQPIVYPETLILYDDYILFEIRDTYSDEIIHTFTNADSELTESEAYLTYRYRWDFSEHDTAFGGISVKGTLHFTENNISDYVAPQTTEVLYDNPTGELWLRQFELEYLSGVCDEIVGCFYTGDEYDERFGGEHFRENFWIPYMYRFDFCNFMSDYYSSTLSEVYLSSAFNVGTDEFNSYTFFNNGTWQSTSNNSQGFDYSWNAITSISCNHITTPAQYDIVSSTRFLVSETNEVNFSIESIKAKSGCTDTLAINFDLFAEIDDGTCKYKQDCDDKYLQEGSINLENVIKLNEGYNMVSYPYTFSNIIGLNFFNVLNNSYKRDGDEEFGNFSDNDFITTYFEGKLYSATFIDGEWKSVSSDGFKLENVIPGMGFVLNVKFAGELLWNMGN